MITGIVVALPEEISTLTANKIDKGCSISLSENILVAYSGAGFKNAQKASQDLLEQGAERLISWGCAAALAPNLKPGDLVIANQLIDADLHPIDIQSTWLQHTVNILKQYTVVFSGKLAESRSIVANSSDKAMIHQQSQAIALDMESIAIAKVAAKADRPFMAIRAVADPANMNLPAAITYAMNNKGVVILSKLLCFLLTHPLEIPGLIKLGLHFNSAKNKLKLIAQHLDTISDFSSI